MVLRGVKALVSNSSRSRTTFTTRDMDVLSWLGQQYGSSLEVLRAELGKTNPDVGRSLSRRGARNQVMRWEEQRLVRVEHLLGSTWVTLSPEGLRRLGLTYPPWALPVTRLNHVHAVNVVRLWFETSNDPAKRTWICERDLFAERGRSGTWHIGDAALSAEPGAVGTGAGPHWLVEVELTPKARGRYVSEVFESLRPTVEGLVYFVPPAHLERVRTDVSAAQSVASRGSTVRLTFRPLPGLDDVERRLNGGH